MRVASTNIVSDAGPMIVGIIGGSGSGKSWLAQRLAGALGSEKAAVVCQDSFYKCLGHIAEAKRGKVNFDDPQALDWAAFRKCLTHLASGRIGRIPEYNFVKHTRCETESMLLSRPVVIFEGLWLLHRPALRRFFSLKVFLNAEADLCLDRRVARDCAERGRCEAEVRAWYEERVLPMQRLFVDPQARHADLVFEAPVSEEKVNFLVKRIEQGLQAPGGTAGLSKIGFKPL